MLNAPGNKRCGDNSPQSNLGLLKYHLQPVLLCRNSVFKGKTGCRMPPNSEELLKSMHQGNQGTEEKSLQGETAVAPWPCMRACLPLPYMQEVWRYIILLKGYAQWYGPCLPHVIKPCTGEHSPQGGHQQTEAHKYSWCFWELFTTHQLQKQNSGKTKKCFTYSLSQ